MRILSYAATVAALLALNGSARAGWETTGSVTSAPSGSGIGVISYAVFHNDTGNPLTAATLGVSPTVFNAITGGLQQGSTANLTSATYLYFYQVVNATPSNSFLNGLLLGTDTSKVQAAGSASGYVFTDAGGAVGPSGNTGLDNGATPGFALSGAALSAFYGGGSVLATNPSVPAINFGFFLPAPNHPPTNTPTTYTSIVFIASNSPPHLSTSNILDGAVTSASLPVPTPEPGTLVLFALAAPVLGLGYARRMRKNLQDATASIA